MTARAYTRNVTVLAACQALFFMANTIVITVTALVGLQYAPTPALASLALGLQFFGTMAATMPATPARKPRRDCRLLSWSPILHPARCRIFLCCYWAKRE